MRVEGAGLVREMRPGIVLHVVVAGQEYHVVSGRHARTRPGRAGCWGMMHLTGLGVNDDPPRSGPVPCATEHMGAGRRNRAPGVSVPVARSGDRPAEPRMGAGYHVLPMKRGFVYLVTVLAWPPRCRPGWLCTLAD